MEKDYILIAVDVESKFAIRLMCLKHSLSESIELHRLQGPLAAMYANFIVGSVLLGSRSDEQEATLYKIDLENSPLNLNCEISPLGPYRSAIFPPEKKGDYKSPPVGQFKVTRTFKGKDNYQSIIPLKGTSIQEMFKSYLTRSIQRDSLLFISTDIDSGKHYGLWVEKLPDTSDKDWKDFSKRFESESYFLDSFKNTNDPDKIVNKLFPETIKILAITKPHLHCLCSKERLLKAMASLPANELVELFMEKQGVESQCDYCHKVWSVSDKDIQSLIKSQDTKKTVH